MSCGEQRPAKLPVQPATAAQTGVGRLKWVVLAVLVLQNSSASLLMKLAVMSGGSGSAWNSQTGVIMQEVIKAVLCILLSAREGTLGGTFSNRVECLKTAVPAALYLLQNNLQYVSVTYLDASTYAVLYQLKIISTALMSVAILDRTLSLQQWVALVMLTAGASAVVVSHVSEAGRSSDGQQSIFLGLAAVLMACCCSGLAGVYFEKLLKRSSVSLWTRNLQLAIYSIVIGFGGLYGSNPEFSVRDDFFRGFNVGTWCSIMANALGGLLIAVVIKYADNILKNFATSLSIVLTAVASLLVFGTAVNMHFCMGAALVIQAVFLYGIDRPWATLLAVSDSLAPGRQARSPKAREALLVSDPAASDSSDGGSTSSPARCRRGAEGAAAAK